MVEAGEYRLARPLPEKLREAVEDTALALGLATDWLNPGPTDQLKQGLPVGFRDRTRQYEFGGIKVHLAGRYDQICLKLYAATDSDPGSKHVQDLIQLDPSDAEIRDAAIWVKQQDSGLEFASFVDAVVAHLGTARGQR